MHLVFAFLVCIIASPAWAGNVLVVRSDAGDELVQGRVIDGAQPLRIPAGRRAVLMDEAGVVVTLNGPYEGKPGGAAQGADPDFLPRMAKLLTSKPRNAREPRSIGIASPAFDPWVIDVTSAGTKCAKPDGKTLLWRPMPLEAASLSVIRGDDQPIRVNWPENFSTVEWPKDVPLTDDVTYLFEINAAKPQRNFFKIRILTPTPASEGLVLDWLAESGCVVQANVWITQLGRARTIDGAAAGKDLFAAAP